MFISCGDKKNSAEDDIWVAPVPSKTIENLDPQNIDGDETISGKKYTYHYTFAPSDSMPIITSFSGQKYKDNEVDLTVRNDSGIILKKHFTKRSFSEFVPANKLKSASLTAFYPNNLKENKGPHLYFLANIGDPEDNDENIYFIEIRVSPNGDIHMEKGKSEELSTQSLDPSLNESADETE